MPFALRKNDLVIKIRVMLVVRSFVRSFVYLWQKKYHKNLLASALHFLFHRHQQNLQHKQRKQIDTHATAEATNSKISPTSIPPMQLPFSKT